jgi:tetratricopeptide (TPR) repeat protein
MVKEVANFASKVQGKAWHVRAYTQLCLTYQLQASVTGDQFQHVRALHIYQQAFAIACELGNVELQAAVRVREGVVLMRQDNPLEAITYLSHALKLVERTAFHRLRGNILSLLSEAYAKAQQAQECWRAIGLAARVLEQKEQTHERSYRLFSPAVMTAHHGIDALLLKDYERADKLIEKSLRIYNPTQAPGRARLLARNAEACLGMGKIDLCIDHAEQALNLSRSVGASNTIVRITELQQQLERSRWKREPGVARLRALLVTSQAL